MTNLSAGCLAPLLRNGKLLNHLRDIFPPSLIHAAFSQGLPAAQQQQTSLQSRTSLASTKCSGVCIYTELAKIAATSQEAAP